MWLQAIDTQSLQWLNPAKLSITGPEALATGLSSGVDVEGYLYNEATFIS